MLIKIVIQAASHFKQNLFTVADYQFFILSAEITWKSLVLNWFS